MTEKHKTEAIRIIGNFCVIYCNSTSEYFLMVTSGSVFCLIARIILFPINACKDKKEQHYYQYRQKLQKSHTLAVWLMVCVRKIVKN